MLENQHVDRALRAVFVGLAVGMAWGIRGDFGGVDGAMYPGAMLGLAFCYVSGQESVMRRMPVIALLSGLFIGLGGNTSYGILHGYAKSDTLPNYSYGFLMLLFQGGCWGLFGGGAVGLALDDRRPKLGEALAVAAAVVVTGVLLEKFVTNVVRFEIDSRGNSLVPFMGGGAVFVAWLAARKYAYGLRGAFFGFTGFGAGMFFGRFLSNGSEHFPWTMNNWNVMEVGCGLIGGFVFTWGMVGLPDRNDTPDSGTSPWALAGIIYAAAFIPLEHLAVHVKSAVAKPEWMKLLTEYGHADPAATADRIYSLISVVALCGVAVAGAWYWWHSGEHLKWAWIPALGLSLIMLVFQCLNALYFQYPDKPDFLDMHTVLWVMLALMALYIALRTQHEPLDVDDEDEWGSAALGWGAGLLALLVITVIAAGSVNGEKTMRSAEMKWPQWSFRDGPPPANRK